MASRQDFVVIPFSKEREISAEYFAIQNILRVFPYTTLKQVSEEHIEQSKIELLSEFAFMEHILVMLDSHANPTLRRDVSKIELAARYALLIGIYDTISEKTISERTIELKPFKTRIGTIDECTSIDLVLSLVEFPKPDIYVQSFVTKEGDIILTGFCRSKDTPVTAADSRIVSIPISNLKVIKSLPAEFRLI
jgi:hypothetical protein